MRTKTLKQRGFRFFTGDVNYLAYGGLWARRISATRYHFVELTNMNEACGRDNEGHPTFVVELTEVDLAEVSEEQQRRALDCLGMTTERLAEWTDEALAQIAYACHSYGIKSPLHDVSTNNARKGIAECRKESYLLTRDPEAYERAMDRPVNLLGSTAREFGRGDLDSALLRGVAAGDKTARIIGKMYVVTNGQTLGGKMDDETLEALRSAIQK